MFKPYLQQSDTAKLRLAAVVLYNQLVLHWDSEVTKMHIFSWHKSLHPSQIKKTATPGALGSWRLTNPQVDFCHSRAFDVSMLNLRIAKLVVFWWLPPKSRVGRHGIAEAKGLKSGKVASIAIIILPKAPSYFVWFKSMSSDSIMFIHCIISLWPILHSETHWPFVVQTQLNLSILTQMHHCSATTWNTMQTQALFELSLRLQEHMKNRMEGSTSQPDY